MKTWEYQSNHTDGLSLVDRAVPQPQGQQVLVRMKAASLNYRDLKVRERIWGGRDGLIPLSDGAGEVVAVGGAVSQFHPGDRVAATFFQSWKAGKFEAAHHSSTLGGAIDGVLAEFALFPQEGLVHTPPDLTWEESATLPCAALTAWNSLFHSGSLRAGDTLLVQGTGSVSMFAAQFAAAAGARVLVTSSDDAKLEKMLRLGADAGVNYRVRPDWDVWAIEQSRDGVDHVLDVGGSLTLGRSLAAVRPQGTVTVAGVLTGSDASVGAVNILSKQVHLLGVNVGSREMFEQMNRAITTAGLRPVIDRVFAFGDAREAFRYVSEASRFGKTVIRIGD